MHALTKHDIGRRLRASSSPITPVKQSVVGSLARFYTVFAGSDWLPDICNGNSPGLLSGPGYITAVIPG